MIDKEKRKQYWKKYYEDHRKLNHRKLKGGLQ